MLRRLLRPGAITIVGASPNGHVTEHLVRNLRHRSCKFGGPIHLVNPGYRKLFDLACHADTASLPGPPGLVYLLVPGAACMPALRSLRERPDGVVLFPDASAGGGGYEVEVGAWGWKHGVPVIGPQSNGLVSVEGKVNGLLIPIIDRLQPGGVAILAQSGGVLGGVVKFFAQRGIGIHSAIEYGTACMLAPWMLGGLLLNEPGVRAVAVYADGVDSLRDFGAFLEAARQAGKPVVAMVAGASQAARHAIGSHSGMAATPRRILEGLAAQHGAVLAQDLDELAWSVEVIVHAGFRPPPGSRVALFSDSGGGGIATAEAVEALGVALDPPEGSTRASVEARFGAALNPFDFGSASMGMAREQAADIAAVAGDTGFGTFAFASTIGLAVRERSVHVKQLDDFASTVESLRRVPFIVSPLPFRDEDDTIGSRALYGNGSKESAVKLRALSTIAGGTPATRQAPGGSRRADRQEPLRHPAVESGLVVTGAAAQAMLGELELLWPRQVAVSAVDELDALSLAYPVVVKTEAGVAHRAKTGGVLLGVERPSDLRNAVGYLLGRFGGAVSISELIEHEVEYFLGAQRVGDDFFVLLGSGGEAAESAGVRLAPMRLEHIGAFAEERTPDDAARVGKLIAEFQVWLAQATGVNAVDLNPIVPVRGGLMALDAKIHRA